MINEKEEKISFHASKPIGGVIVIDDISIPDGILTVNFEKIAEEIEECTTENKIITAFLSLKNVNKSFPNIEKLILAKKTSVYVKNEMFPNLKEVEYPDGKICNILCNSSYLRVTLHNVFTKKAGELIDLSSITEIDQDSFSGCMSDNVINTQSVEFCHELAFRNSIFEQKAKIHDVVMAGTILAYINPDVDVYLPDTITAFRDKMFDGMTIKHLIIDTASTIKPVTVDIRINKLTVNKISENDTLILACLNATEYSVPENNTHYKSVDGVIYSKDGKKLFYFPTGRTGNFTIPDCVEEICKFAFYNTKISSVFIPASVKVIGECAFTHSELSEIHLGNGISEIGHNSHDYGCGVFHGCKNLRHITIPPNVKRIHSLSFLHSGLCSIELNEGLQEIHDYAFQICRNLIQVRLPKSLTLLGNENFVHAKEFFLNAEPKDQINSICSTNSTDNFIRTFHVDDKTFYIPSDASADDIRIINQLFNDKRYDDIINRQMSMKMSASMKREIAVKMYKNGQADESVEKYIKKNSYKIAEDYLSANSLKVFTWFITQGFLSAASLKKLLAKANDLNDPVVSSYIIDEINKLGQKTSFQL